MTPAPYSRDGIAESLVLTSPLKHGEVILGRWTEGRRSPGRCRPSPLTSGRSRSSPPRWARPCPITSSTPSTPTSRLHRRARHRGFACPAVLRAQIHRACLLVCGRDGGRVRDDVRRRRPHRAEDSVRGLRGDLRGGSHRHLHRLVPGASERFRSTASTRGAARCSTGRPCSPRLPWAPRLAT